MVFILMVHCVCIYSLSAVLCFPVLFDIQRGGCCVYYSVCVFTDSSSFLFLHSGWGIQTDRILCM